MAMKPPSRPYNAVAKKAALFEILDASARHAKVCPKVDQLAKLLEISSTRVDELLKALRNEGRITWQLIYCGTGVGHVRIVTIKATGATTARPATQHRPKGSLAAVKAERTELERAKTGLRRLGRIVFDAEVTDGARGRGLVKVDYRDRKPAEVIALAQQAGAI